MRSRTTCLLLAALGALGLLSAAPAAGEQVHQYFYSGETFEAGGPGLEAIAFDAANQDVLVVDTSGSSSIRKLTAAGIPDPFSGLAGNASFFTPNPSHPLERASIAVDNSGTASDGNFYVTSRNFDPLDLQIKVYGFAADGTPLAGFPFTPPAEPCAVAVAPNGGVWVGFINGIYRQYTSAGVVTRNGVNVGQSIIKDCRIDFDSVGNLYAANGTGLEKYSPSFADLGSFAPKTSPIGIDRGDDSAFTLSDNLVTQSDSAGNPVTTFGGADPAHFSYPGLSGATALAADPENHDVYVAKAGGLVDVFSRDAATTTIPTTTTGAADGLSGTGATLRGVVNPDGVATTGCYFEWGATAGYGTTAPCAEGNAFSGGSGDNAVSAAIANLAKGATYHFRLVSKNANDVLSYGRDATFSAVDPPLLANVAADHITTDSARVAFDVSPNGGPTSYRLEVGTDTDYGTSFPVPDAAPPALNTDTLLPPLEPFEPPRHSILMTFSFSQELSGLSPDTLYHYRVVATNASGVTKSADRTFTTFLLPSTAADTCANAHVRQQTGAAGLLDCRAYELVSAAFTGGYDVRSELTPGVTPLSTSPSAVDEALYSMRSGTIPGIAGDPTNRGADPYVATRGKDGWSTRYVGLPATNPYASEPFASPLLGFDSGLDTFAYGGPEICMPCFADGSTNVPLRLADGSIVKGMAAATDPGPAESAGAVRAPLSADGSHFVFGSTIPFISGASTKGDATLYDRSLGKKGITQIVSRLPTGVAIKNGLGIAELGISAEGSRIVFGQLVSTDAAGNHYYHLYMHVGTSHNTIDLTPGANSGAIFDGMTSDATKVYFTTKDQLVTAADQDSDSSADIYRADVEPEAESATLIRVSTGAAGAGNTDSCDPPPNSFGVHWNVVGAVGSSAGCSVAAVAGGGGVASGSGDLYFVSPERLDTSDPQNLPVQDEPNLYLARPGQPPRFVVTLESKSTGAAPLPTRHPFTKSFGAFTSPQSVAVDQSAGYVYVLDAGAGTVKRFNSDGEPVKFTAGPNANTNTLTGFTFGFSGQTQTAQVAIDNSSGPAAGDVYIANNSSASPVVKIFARSGAALGQLSGSANPQTRFGGATGTAKYPTGVTTSTNGDLYVSGGNSGKVYRYVPKANPVVESDYDATLNYGPSGKVPGPLAADSSGNVYVGGLNALGAPTGGLKKYTASQFGAVGEQVGAAIDPEGVAAYVDPKSNYLYVDRRTEIAEYLPSGALHGTFGSDKLTSSRGVAVLGSPDATTSRIYASSVGGSNNVSVFDTLPASSPMVDNPLVTDAVNAADVRNGADFQPTPSGDDAVFVSTLPLSGFDSGRKEEIFHYDTTAGLACVSCSPTGARPAADTLLTAYGSNLTDDGRVFFTSAEPLVLRDSNEKSDAYEWSGGAQQLISTGTSPSDSSLLSVDSDGADAFFFTRQKLVPEDENGGAVRLYTAREDGGFPFGPPEFECAASDECHGAGTQAPPPPPVGTLAGAPGQFEAEPKGPPKCPGARVRRHGRCVPKRPHKKRNHRRAGVKRAGAKR